MPDKTETLTAPPATENEHELPETDLLEEELVVEEISIDGMCGVY